jgi:hypothetical protein
MNSPKPILLVLKNAPGDTVVLTGAVRDLAIQHPGRFNVSVGTNADSVWNNNPHVVPPQKASERVEIEYAPEMTRGNRGPQHVHFLAGFHNILSSRLGVPLVPTLPRPDLHLTAADTHLPLTGPYWVIFPGHKRDIPLKAWPAAYWQQLIDQLAGWGIRCVQVGREDFENPQLYGVENHVGKTSLRNLFALIRDAAGVICGITQGMHIAAALEKPCVVLAGSRESWWWEAYVNENTGFGPVSGSIQIPHRYLHTFGMLSCCQKIGCHKQALFASLRHAQDKVCTQQTPILGVEEAVCMSLVTPDKARDAVLSYYLDRTLVPHNDTLREMVQQMPELLPVDRPLTILRADGTTLEIKATPAEAAATPANPILPGIILPRRAAFVPDAGLDSEAVGARVTICVMMYGDFWPMHKRCLDAILTTTAAERVELRVGGNQLCEKTTQYIEQLCRSGDIQLADLSPENRGKYPVMRRLFHDTPLRTNWVIWFDDDTFCDSNPTWLSLLTVAISSAASDVACFGPLYYYTLTPAWQKWCAAAPWFKSVPWIYSGLRALVHFSSGGFWALTKNAIETCDIPDVRLGHNKGDVTIGCQLHQRGFKICRFSQHKEIVRWSDASRRGITERHPAE